MAVNHNWHYVGCSGTDYLQGTSEKLSDVISCVLASCELGFNASLDEEGIYNYTCDKMRSAIERRTGGSCLQLGGTNHYFRNRNQLMDGVDVVVKAIVGAALSGTNEAASVVSVIKNIFEASANQADHVSNANSILWNSQKSEMNFSSTTVTIIWNNCHDLTITPVLIKVNAMKGATKILWYKKEEMSGCVSVKQSAFNFTKGYCLNAVR